MTEAFNFRKWLRGRKFPGYDLIVCPETEIEPTIVKAVSEAGQRWAAIQMADAPMINPDYVFYVHTSPEQFIATITEDLTLGIVVDGEVLRVGVARLQ